MTPNQFIILIQKWKEGKISRSEAREFAAALHSGHFDELAMDVFESHIDAGDLNELANIGRAQR